MSTDPTNASSEYLPEESVVNEGQANESPPSQATEPLSFLDQVIEQTTQKGSKGPESFYDSLLNFCDEFAVLDSASEELRFLYGDPSALTKKEISLRSSQLIAEFDELLNEQVNEIIHHSKFQKLEASWRGIEFLVDQVVNHGAENVKIRVLDVSWRELTKDLAKATEFDQSQAFKKIYEEEFGTPGGQPYGMLIGDYQIHPRPTEDHKFEDDIGTLSKIAGIAAASFCPFISSTSPSMFGLNHFAGLQHVESIERGFEGHEFQKWRAFRDTDDARFVGLTMPNVLMRKPYTLDVERTDGFPFIEDTADRDRKKYLWGNAAYAFGEVVIRAYAQSGWLAEIRGVQRDVDWGGLVTGLPVHSFGTDRTGVAPKSSVDIDISDMQESALSSLGFLPLSHCWDTDYCAFYNTQSAQKARSYDRPVATQNSKISAMLHYMLCVSKFAHYIKVLARDKIGSHLAPEDCEKVLDRWIKKYVTPDDHASQESKARRPLRGAEVKIQRVPGQPGSYMCTLHLWPHYQLDDLTANVRLQTTLKPLDGSSGG